MTLSIRRVVTGHDDAGRARVFIDGITDNVISRRPGQESAVVWATDRHPPDLAALNDIAAGVQGTVVPGGTVFRISRLEPGVTPRRHRTASLDYGIVLSGAVDMELDDGECVTLRAGDVLVQRGTVHNWINRGAEPCVIAFILIAAPLPEGLESAG